ncbi:MAG: peptide ABC transporter substrate-binding protein [Alphaproteobacteria bacterium]|nr:peptide ABC transporter substrate-binding protein [Alphaproteobacteria bacterium]PHY00703.1 MAG: peptide ABC transporter substrate-binding protein [Rhodospirillaceae bacterium]
MPQSSCDLIVRSRSIYRRIVNKALGSAPTCGITKCMCMLTDALEIQMSRKSQIAAAVLALLAFGVPPQETQAAMIFHRGNTAEPDSLDPHLTTSGYAGNIIFDMFVGLTTLDSKANLLPGAAESWTISPDGKTYTFKIRKGMLWSDGTPVTAEDFAYAFRRTMDPKTASRAAPMLYMISNAREINSGKAPVESLGVRAVDTSTFEVKLLNPTPYFLELIAHRCYPVPRWAIEKFGKDWTKPANIVVNGAFKLAEWTPQSQIRLVRNPKFFANDTVKLDEVIFYPTEDQNSALKRYRADELDVIVNFPPSQYEWLKENLPKDLTSTQNYGLLYYTFNTRKAPFNDPRVRNALAMTLDREMFVDKIMRGGELAAYSLIPEVMRKGYVPPPSPWHNVPMAERMTKAKALLAEAGYGPDKPLRFTFRYNTDDIQRRVALAAAQVWKTMGVESQLQNSELNILNADLRNGDYEVARYQWFAEYADPTSFLYLLESTTVGDNHSKYNNPEYDAVMQKVYQEADIAKRTNLMREAEAIALRDSPITPINFYVSKRLAKPYVKGMDANPRGINISRYVTIER